ncbi:Aste57867_18812 [Aphanomyces stellatus]|uniref:Aste57867_18812 protein n=1 Tax=Aphanomyces stellatus TaxID=120398 RepID=A0A485LB99_9STRA|nr:hypothetical protein As57867_018748 [Aphanomyces stellatus]VFT95546.1 Aste57867_18812 [Aphanomyces stellatus]
MTPAAVVVVLALFALECISTISSIPTRAPTCRHAVSLSSATTTTTSFLIYLIRHGEKPDDDTDPNLSPRGEARAACLAQKWVHYGFTELLCPHFNPVSGKRGRACQTIRPLSTAMGLPLNSTIGRDDYVGAAAAALTAAKRGPVLVAWEHKALAGIAKALNGKKRKYPGRTFDLIWIYNPNDGTFLPDGHENC